MRGFAYWQEPPTAAELDGLDVRPEPPTETTGLVTPTVPDPWE